MSAAVEESATTSGSGFCDRDGHQLPQASQLVSPSPRLLLSMLCASACSRTDTSACLQTSSPHSAMLALSARFALRWRAIVVARRATILLQVAEFYQRKRQENYDDRRDPNLVAAAINYHFEVNSDESDVLYALPECLRPGCEFAKKMGLRWRTGELGLVFVEEYNNTLDAAALGYELGKAFNSWHHAALRELVRSLPSAVLSCAAIPLQPVMWAMLEYYLTTMLHPSFHHRL